ncbi:MAG: SPOR domain-containing protein [Spirochaetaceae bacterium]|jgi:DedD protein|nr:SPOR domain-containing protein [Spirochaetaceae bacterium]
MEKKKLLLVSVSVGLFLVIVIGASILVFSPRDYPSATKAEIVPISPGKPQVSVAATSSEPPPSPAVTQSDSSTAPINNEPPRTLENVIYINGDNADNAVRVERLNDGNTRTIITIPSPRENIITVTAPQPVAATAVPQTETVAATPPPSSNTTVAASTPKASGTTPTPSAGNVKTEKPAASNKPAWWVQTSSYSKKAYADNAKKFLESKGITSVIMNGVVGGKTFYRVRVGPYSSQAEADYWLSLIKTIEGMENSLVWKGSNL